MINEIKTPKKITSDLAEETGLHIGDGSMNFYKNKNKTRGFYQLRGHIIDDKEHYETRIKELYNSVYNLKPSMREMKSTGVYGFQIWSDAIINFKKQVLKLPLGEKVEIGIPKIFYKKKEFLVSVLRGIYDTDGCLYLEKRNNRLYPRMEFKTTSKKLSKQIDKILLSLNLRATRYSFTRKEENQRDLYTVCIRGNEYVPKAFNLIKPANQKHIKKFEFYKEKYL